MPLLPTRLLSDIPPGTIAEFETEDATFAICNVNGEIFCVNGLCPHMEGPLAQGALQGATIVCPWHGWEFDVRTGAPELGDCQLEVFPIVIKEDRIFIQLP